MSGSKEEQLWEASTEGNLELVTLLANDPAVDVNWGDPVYNRTAFYRACGHGRVAVVEFLLRHPRIDVNKPMIEGATPFKIACQCDRKEVVSLLLADPRIDFNKPNSKGYTAFTNACMQGRQNMVSQLLADMRIDINKPENNQCTPLWFVSCYGHLPVARLILVSGREVDTKTSPFLTLPLGAT